MLHVLRVISNAPAFTFSVRMYSRSSAEETRLERGALGAGVARGEGRPAESEAAESSAEATEEGVHLAGRDQKGGGHGDQHQERQPGTHVGG